jgi:SHS2 domain-containing protein
MYQKFDHGADVGIKGIGKDLNQAFTETAKAMFDVMVDIGKINPGRKVKIEVKAENKEELLVEFLNKLLSEADLKNMVFSEFQVLIKFNKLKALAFGEKLSPKKHNIKTEVKAATYSMLEIGQEGENFYAQCVIDV